VDKTAAGFVVIGFLLVLLALMWLGWRNLRKRSTGIPAPQPIPDGTGPELFHAPGMHVATTHAGRPLDRVVVRGLDFRATGDVRVTPAGVELRLAGGAECFLPAAAIARVDRASWTIDRAVERGGLVVITWTLGDTPIDTNLRVEDPAALVAAVSTLPHATHEGTPA